MYIVILIVECLCIWFLFVETKGRTLEEVAVILDGEVAMAVVEGEINMEKEDLNMASHHENRTS